MWKKSAFVWVKLPDLRLHERSSLVERVAPAAAVYRTLKKTLRHLFTLNVFKSFLQRVSFLQSGILFFFCSVMFEQSLSFTR